MNIPQVKYSVQQFSFRAFFSNKTVRTGDRLSGAVCYGTSSVIYSQTAYLTTPVRLGQITGSRS